MYLESLKIKDIINLNYLSSVYCTYFALPDGLNDYFVGHRLNLYIYILALIWISTQDFVRRKLAWLAGAFGVAAILFYGVHVHYIYLFDRPFFPLGNNAFIIGPMTLSIEPDEPNDILKVMFFQLIHNNYFSSSHQTWGK